MDTRTLLEQVREGLLSVEDAEAALAMKPIEDLGHAKLDLHRAVRSGFPEVVYCAGKADAFLADIFKHLYEKNGEVMGTRASAHQYDIVREVLPEIRYDEVSRILKLERTEKERTGMIAVCSAGTADIPVAEEAA